LFEDGSLRAFEVGIRLIDFVDGDDEGDLGFANLRERLERLCLYAIVSCDDENGDVGNVGPTCANGRESSVTRSVDEGNFLIDTFVLVDYLVCGDVLCDTASFSRDDVGLADKIEKCRLTVVDVPHHHNDRRTH
jgi:hypothetical protein